MMTTLEEAMREGVVSFFLFFFFLLILLELEMGWVGIEVGRKGGR